MRDTDKKKMNEEMMNKGTKKRDERNVPRESSRTSLCESSRTDSHTNSAGGEGGDAATIADEKPYDVASGGAFCEGENVAENDPSDVAIGTADAAKETADAAKETADAAKETADVAKEAADAAMEGNKENKMGTQPIWKLLLIIGFPMIVSLAVQSLYNIVDTLFVSRMPGEAGDASAALIALGYAYPIQIIMIAIGIGTGVGANAAISRALGEGNKAKADKIAGNTLFLGVIIYAVFLIFGATPLTNLYVKLYGNVDQNVVDYTVTYLRICCCVSVFNLYFNLYEKILQSTGKSQFTMISQVSGAVVNIILDPIFISTMKLGITGAAIATILGQTVGFALNFVFHLRFNREISNSMKNWKPSGKIIKEIFRVGIAAIISQVLMAVMTIIMGVFLTKVDNQFFAMEDGTYCASYSSAYSTFYKVQQFALFLGFGIRDAVTPIAAYNHGRGYKKRVKQTMRYGLLYTVILMVVCIIIVETATEPLMGIFAEGFTEGVDSLGNEVSTLGICVNAARIIGASFIFAGVCILFQGMYQALGAGVPSLIVSVCRQILIVIPIVAVATSLMVRQGTRDLEWLIWVSFIIAEFVTAIVATVFMYFIYKKHVSPMSDAADPNAADPDAASAGVGTACDRDSDSGSDPDIVTDPVCDSSSVA